MTGADPWRRVAALTVTHHSAAVIGACLESIRRAAQVIVIDNASDDDTCAIVERVAPGAELVRNPVGVGFGNAMNQGLERVRTEFALLANPDSVLAPGAVEALVAAADRYADAAMIGPTIVNAHGSVELSHDVALFERGRYGKRTREAPPEGDCCAEFLSGAVLFARVAALREVGGFDPHLFLYYDDDDLCLRLRRAGYSLVLAPSAVAEHVGGGSVRPSAGHTWEKFWHMAWSRLYIEEKYRGGAAMRRVAAGHLARFGLKAIGYGLVLNRAKAWRDAARVCGTAGYLMGVRASKTVPRGRPLIQGHR